MFCKSLAAKSAYTVILDLYISLYNYFSIVISSFCHYDTANYQLGTCNVFWFRKWSLQKQAKSYLSSKQLRKLI